MTHQPHSGPPARSSDLHRTILRNHLTYLSQEETPAKLEKRRHLENLITEYLGAVSHNSKFSFSEFASILNNSVDDNLGFSAYKAGSAFEALEKYATNLISHPWRKEYRAVKLYSGFYKHNVESQLLGGSCVFHLLGYRFNEDGVLSLDGPIDPDKVARVALDCLIAYVECQVMIQICERVKAFKCSWPEIHSVRQDYTCGIDEAVRILHQLKRNVAEQEKQDRWLRNKENGSATKDHRTHSSYESSYQPQTGILVDLSNTWPSNGVSHPVYSQATSILQPTVLPSSYGVVKSKTSGPSHVKLLPYGSPSWDVGKSFLGLEDRGDHKPRYGLVGKCSSSESKFASDDLSPEDWDDSWDLPPLMVQASSYPGKYSSYGGYGDSKPVPKMRETYATQLDNLYSSHQSIVSREIPSYHVNHDFGIPKRVEAQRHASGDQQPSLLSHRLIDERDGQPSRFYNNHEHASDLCLPLSKLSVEGSAFSKPYPANSTYLSYQTASDLAPDSVLRPNATSKQHNSGNNRSSYYDNVSPPLEDEPGPSLATNYLSNGTSSSSPPVATTTSTLSSKHKNHKVEPSAKLPLKKTQSDGAVTETNGSSDSPKGLKSQLLGLKGSKNSKKWSCTSCTYYNQTERNICDMCGRSKYPGPESTPLVSGGRECPQCTLVNKKDSEDCTACGASLKDSPTYI